MGENGPEKGGTVSPISVFVRFSVDDWHKRTKKCASLYDNASVCTGEKKKPNASVGENILLRFR